jgi:hypothetical protein
MTARSATVEMLEDRVIKRYSDQRAAERAAERLTSLGLVLGGGGQTPTVLDVAGRAMVLERVEGPTLWEVYRGWLEGAPGGADADELMVRAGRLLGQIHSPPVPESGPLGSLTATFTVELAREIDRRSAPSDLLPVASHSDFGPINLIVRDGQLVVLDPEPNGYVTIGDAPVYTRYVDLGTWVSALSYRSSIGHLRALRSVRVREVVRASVAAYEERVGCPTSRSTLRGYASAVTSSYLRGRRVPRLIARSITQRLAWS